MDVRVRAGADVLPRTPTRTGAPTVSTETDVCLRPPATAMAFLAPGQRHEPIAVPGVVLAPGDVLVAVELATVCPADADVVRGSRAAPLPLVLGHECVGRIIACGSAGATTTEGRALHIGDRIVWAAASRAERIAPRWELTGGFATHAHVRADAAIVRVGEEIPAAVLAPALCGVVAAGAALESAAGEVLESLDGAVVLIVGAGLRGVSAAAIATDRGARVVVADPDRARRDLARRFGAVATVDPTCPSGAASLAAALAALGPTGADLTIETSDTVESTPTQLHDAVRYLARRHEAYPFADLVGERMPLHRIDEAFARAAAGDPVRVGIDPRQR